MSIHGSRKKRRTSTRRQSQTDPVSSLEKAQSVSDFQGSVQGISALLAALAKEAAALVGAKACCIYTLDRKRQELTPCASWRAPGSVVDFARNTVGDGLVGLVAQASTQRSSDQAPHSGLRVSGLKNDPRFKATGPGLAGKTALAIPLRISEEEAPAGVLVTVDKPDDSDFSADDEQTLVTFARRSNLALAIENARLEQARERSAQELRTINQVGQTLTAAPHLADASVVCRAVLYTPGLADLFQFDMAEMWLWDDQSQMLATVLRLPEDKPEIQAYPRTCRSGQGYAGWIAATQKSLLIGNSGQRSDVTPAVGLANFPYRSYIGVPLVVQSRFLGTLELAALPTHFYDERDIAVLETIANQTAVAIDQVRLYSLTDQQLQKRVDELAGLQRVSSELNSTLDLDKVLSSVLEEAIRVTQADYGSVNLYDTESETFIAHKEQGGAPEGPGPHPRRRVTAEVPIINQALQSGKAVLAPDVRPEDNIVGGQSPMRSKAVVPIYYRGEPAGLINLESSQVDFFTNDQLRYLEALSNQAAVAIGNAQAYQEQKRERELTSRRADQLAHLSEISDAFRTNRPLAEVLEDIAYAVVESVGYNVVLISVVEGRPPTIRHEVGAGVPIAQFEEVRGSDHEQPLPNPIEIMRDEFRLSKSYFIPAEHREIWQDRLTIPYVEKQSPAFSQSSGDSGETANIWQTGDLLFTPLLDTDGNVIGLLTVENPDTGQRPDLSSVQTLEIFANHASVAIENARLFELEQQRRRLADTLRGVAEAISSQLDFDELLNIVLQALRKVVDYDSTSVQLLEKDRLVIIGGHGWEDSQQIIGLSFPMEGANPNRLVIETQEPVIVNKAQTEYPESFGPPHERIKSWLGVPLTYGANVLGLMAVDSLQDHFFTREEAEVVLAFANQVAVALQNARLFEEARQQVRQLAALTEVAQALNRALDLSEVLNLVLDAVFDLVGPSKGSIWLVDHSTNTIKIANTKDVSDLLVELFNESDISVESEPFASVIKSGQVQVIMGTPIVGNQEVPDHLPVPGDVTYVPLKTEDGVIGILAIETIIHNKNMLQLVTTLADLAAVAMESAHLLEDTRRQAREMQYLYNLGVEVSGMLDVREVMRSVIDSAITLTETQVGLIFLWDEEGEQYIIDSAFSRKDGATEPLLQEVEALSSPQSLDQVASAAWRDLIEKIVDKEKPLVVTSTAGAPATLLNLEKFSTEALLAVDQVQSALPEGVRAALGVPLRFQSQTRGAILVCNLAPRKFNRHDVQLLSFVANQAAVAISNAQLVQRLNLFNEELERRVVQRTEELARTLQDLTEERDRVGTLYQITRELAASFDLDRMLTEALSLINRAVGISHGSILLLDNDTGHLIYRAALGRDKPLGRGGHQTSYKIGHGLAGKVMESRRARIIPDLSQAADWITVKEEPDRRSALAVPLITGDDVLGAMLLFHPDIDYFTEDHLKLVTAAGAQVATAVNNAELYRLITDQAERLGVMLRTQAAETAKNQAILEGITEGVLVLDPDRKVVLLNPKGAEILDVKADTVENQPLRQILGQPESPVEEKLTQQFYDNLVKSLLKIEAGESSADFRVEVDNKTVTVSLAPVALGAENRPSIVAVIRDISKEAEVDRIKNEFISTVSHELRTPMTSIKGYADLLVAGSTQVGELNATQQRFVRVIQSNANRLTDLVNDILEISRIETGRVKLDFETLNLVEVIKEVALSFEGQTVQKPMHLSLDLPDDLPEVYADKSRLTQILVNLIGNAWQYTPQRGKIIVRARLADSDFVQVDVEDNGIGIPEKDLEYIFERFYRSERPEVQVVDGTGLGLSITKMFVEMLGGTIEVKSQVDVGTIFSFTAPLKPGAANQENAPATLIMDTKEMRSQPHVLIIEDEPEVADRLKPHLEAEGYQVLVAHKEQEVLKLARSASKVLKVIVLDILLEGADSFALLQQLQEDEKTAHVPVVISSLSTAGEGEVSSPEIVDYIATSYEETQVLQSIGRALKRVKDDPQEVENTVDKTYYRDRHSRRVLIVDNNSETVKWLKDALDASGYDVQRAFNSYQALDMAVSAQPDLILISTRISEMNGEHVISQLHQTMETRDIPIILITDRSVPPWDGAKISILKNNRQASNQSLAVEAVAAAIIRLSGNAAPPDTGH